MKYQLIIAFLCLGSVKCDDEVKFNATRVAIRDVIRQTSDDFDIFMKELEKDTVKLIQKQQQTENKIINFASNPKPNLKNVQCTDKLVVKIIKLNQDFRHSIDTSPEAIIVRQTINEFMIKMGICYEDLADMARYFDCLDEECKQEVHAEADEQLRRSTEGLRVKGMRQKIIDNYPGIDQIVQEYTIKLDEIRNKFKNC